METLLFWVQLLGALLLLGLIPALVVTSMFTLPPEDEQPTPSMNGHYWGLPHFRFLEGRTMYGFDYSGSAWPDSLEPAGQVFAIMLLFVGAAALGRALSYFRTDRRVDEQEKQLQILDDRQIWLGDWHAASGYNGGAANRRKSKFSMAIDYCRECCCEINESTVTCPECGMRLLNESTRFGPWQWGAVATFIAAGVIYFSIPWTPESLNVPGSLALAALFMSGMGTARKSETRGKRSWVWDRNNRWRRSLCTVAMGWINGSAAEAIAMWQRVTAEPGSRYVLQLCMGENAVRYVRPREAEVGEPDPGRVLETESFPGEWVSGYNFRSIGAVPLADGSRFQLGPHGEWFTAAEMEVLDSDKPEPVPWHGGITPLLPPM
jgi:hypothetical protein